VGIVPPWTTHFTGYCCWLMWHFGQHSLLGIVVGLCGGLRQHTLVGIIAGLMWGLGQDTLLGIVVGLCGGLGQHFTGYCCRLMWGLGQHTVIYLELQGEQGAHVQKGQQWSRMGNKIISFDYENTLLATRGTRPAASVSVFRCWFVFRFISQPILVKNIWQWYNFVA
jgi:hypothetical protein